LKSILIWKLQYRFFFEFSFYENAWAGEAWDALASLLPRANFKSLGLNYNQKFTHSTLTPLLKLLHIHSDIVAVVFERLQHLLAQHIDNVP